MDKGRDPVSWFTGEISNGKDPKGACRLPESSNHVWVWGVYTCVSGCVREKEMGGLRLFTYTRSYKSYNIYFRGKVDTFVLNSPFVQHPTVSHIRLFHPEISRDRKLFGTYCGGGSPEHRRIQGNTTGICRSYLSL